MSPLGENKDSLGKLFIDIETIPGQGMGVYKEIAAGIAPPGNITKPESIERWMQEKAPEKIDHEWRKTSLDGTQGEVAVVSWAMDEDEVQCLARDYRARGSERELLEELWTRLKEENPVLWVGHYLTEFDLRFLWQRSVINRVPPSVPIPYDQGAYGRDVFDTMTAWAGRRGSIKLEALCKALGIDTGNDGMDGSQVWDYVKEGRVSEVAEYCKRDVAAVREAYRRMTFRDLG